MEVLPLDAGPQKGRFPETLRDFWSIRPVPDIKIQSHDASLMLSVLVATKLVC